MNIDNLLVVAARKKFRFDSTKGQLQVEDLFDLPLNSLDTIAVALDEKIQKAGRKSFVAKKSVSTGDDESKLEIVKFVIETKQTEAEIRKTKEANESQRVFLKGLLEKKNMEKLESLSPEEIQKQLDQLG